MAASGNAPCCGTKPHSQARRRRARGQDDMEVVLKKRTLAIAIALVACMLLGAVSAYALAPDTAGNASSSNESLASEKVDSDLFWAGYETTISQTEVGGDIIAAGSKIEVQQSTVAGNIRAAGQTLVFNSTQIARNATVAGSSVSFGQGTSAGGVYVFAEDAGFYGTARYLSVSASTVTIDGTIEGDVDVSAANVTVGDNAKITGTLRVTSTNQPNISSAASIAAQELSASADATSQIASGLSSVSGVVFAITLISTIVLSVLMAWILKRPVAASAEMFGEKPVAILLVGLCSLVVAPIAAILLLLLGVTWPLSIAILCLIVALSCISLPFTAAAMGRIAFKKMNPILSALVMGAIAAVLSIIPVVGTLVSVFATLFMFGYCTKALFSRNRHRGGDAGQAMPVQGDGTGQGTNLGE